jgi:hypothetical protein
MDTGSRAANHSAAVFRAIIAPSGAYPSEFNRVVFFAEPIAKRCACDPEQSAVAAIDDGSPLIGVELDRAKSRRIGVRNLADAMNLIHFNR